MTTPVEYRLPVRFKNPAFLALGLAALAGLSAVATVVLPAKWPILGALALAAGIVWVASLKLGRDFELLFLAVFGIGYVQGLVIKLAGSSIPQSLWGLLKYGLILLMVVGYAARVALGERPLVNRTMLTWLVVWLLNWAMLGALMLEAVQASPLYTPIGTIQVFGVGNMLLGVMAYFRVRPKEIEHGLRLLTGAGVLAAVFGVAQRLAGPDRLAALGLLKGNFLFLSASTPETGFLDLAGGFRAFSFFDSHHAFSAFLILSVAALQILYMRGKMRRSAYLAAMAAMWAGLAVTFNLTNIFSCLAMLTLAVVLERADRLHSIKRALLSRRLWQAAFLVLVISVIVVMSVGALRDRFISIFDVRFGTAGAGASLAGRLMVLTSGIQAVVDYPLGFGLYLNPPTFDISELVGRYARVNGYFESRGMLFTGDNWFQWLMVQIGLPGFLLYATLFLIPISSGIKQRKRVQSRELRSLLNGLLALLIVTFIAGISNSPILVFPPSNLLIWVAAGVLMKLPSWDAELQRSSDQNANWN